MSGTAVEELERQRCALQRLLDGRMSAAQRNRLGRFATPPALALDMLALAQQALDPEAPLRFLDPAVGTGVFFYALMKTLGRKRPVRAAGFEIDPDTAVEAQMLWSGHGLAVRTEDFCRAQPPAGGRGRSTLIVCNPPYVRHHHLAPADKDRLRRRVRALGFDLSGLAGLYAYFLLLADPWLVRGGVGVWIVPAEFLDVGYGRDLKAYLARRVTLLKVHRFDPAAPRFPEALVTSAVVLYRKGRPPRGHRAELACGGTLTAPQRVRTVLQADLDPAVKWSPLWSPGSARRGRGPRGVRLGELFSVRRGLATGANGYFVLDRAEARERRLPRRYLRPVLPGPRHVTGNVIEREAGGFPAGLPALVVLDCDLPIGEIRRRYPGLARYLDLGRRQRIHLRYLPRHRHPWYGQERRPPAPILCTYMGRRRGGRFIRFIRNHSDATATNGYHLLYPAVALRELLEADGALLDLVFTGLQAAEDSLESAGRTYAGGLVKVEPRELEAVMLPRWLRSALSDRAAKRL
ncbi:MAG: Eco57I restriction-modification methylase domain-containing protein [Planctomycetota bacterium]